MYEWFKVLETSRLAGETAENDYNVSQWRELAIRFITDIKIEPDIVVGVDLFSLFYELLNAGLTLPTGNPLQIIIGEGWQITGAPLGEQIELKIGFELVEGREPVVIKTLSKHETMLFIAIKISELVSSMEKLGVRVEGYLNKFPPGTYFRKYPS